MDALMWTFSLEIPSDGCMFTVNSKYNKWEHLVVSSTAILIYLARKQGPCILLLTLPVVAEPLWRGGARTSQDGIGTGRQRCCSCHRHSPPSPPHFLFLSYSGPLLIIIIDDSLNLRHHLTWHQALIQRPSVQTRLRSRTTL